MKGGARQPRPVLINEVKYESLQELTQLPRSRLLRTLMNKAAAILSSRQRSSRFRLFPSARMSSSPEGRVLHKHTQPGAHLLQLPTDVPEVVMDGVLLVDSLDERYQQLVREAAAFGHGSLYLWRGVLS